MTAINASRGKAAVNARVIQDIEPWSLEERQCTTLENNLPHEVLPSHVTSGLDSGAGGNFEFPRPLVASQMVYQGSCPCGAVKVAMQATPLPLVSVNECNCSQCWRHACVFAYPSDMEPQACVLVQGARNLTAFSGWPRRPGGDGFRFCKHCGLWLFVSMSLTGDDNAMQVAEMNDNADTVWTELSIAAINLHVLEKVPWPELKVNKHDGRTKYSTWDYRVS